MRDILVDFARSRASGKRGGAGRRVELDDNMGAAANNATDFLIVHEALEKFRLIEPRKASVIELRFFGGLTFEEVAEALDIWPGTAKRDSAFAEAWMPRQ